MEQANSLEEFIEKLHHEGVEAGLHEGEQLRAAAATESAAIVEEAREQARRIVAEAETLAAAMQAEARAELALAVRDAQLELRERLDAALTSLLEGELTHPLETPETLAGLLAELVRAYAQVDGDAGTFDVSVRADLLEGLSAAAPALLGKALEGRVELDLKGELSAAGFEVRIHDAVVEVTPRSVAEKLASLMSGQLRERLRTAAEQPHPVER